MAVVADYIDSAGCHITICDDYYKGMTHEDGQKIINKAYWQGVRAIMRAVEQGRLPREVLDQVVEVVPHKAKEEDSETET